jgi:hypothetical protein
MNELDTLNMLLRLIGSSPVNSLITEHPDAANALATMKRVSKRVQRRGWWCNIDYNLIAEPDERGAIKVSDDITALVAENRNLILRNKRLYDKRNQTAVFTENVVITRLTRILVWDDMPDVMQDVTAYTAAAEFVRDELEDPQKEQSLKEEAAKSAMDLQKQELEEGRYNIFHTPRIARARGGVQPYNRSNKRFFGDPDV